MGNQFPRVFPFQDSEEKDGWFDLVAATPWSPLMGLILGLRHPQPAHACNKISGFGGSKKGIGSERGARDAH